MRIFRILRESGFRRTLNSVINYAEYSIRRPRILSLPTAVDIEVTTRCPLACNHCPRTYRDKLGFSFPIGDMDREQGLFLLRSLHGVRRVAFQGYGEPLLYPYLFDLLDEARHLKIYSTFSTSAAVVTKDILAGLGQSPPNLITFSCDVIDMRYEESIRRNLDLDQFQENVPKIVQVVRDANQGTVLLFHTCLIGTNHRMLLNIVRFAARMGIPAVDVSELNFSYIERWRDQLLPPDRQAMLADLESARRLGVDLGVNVHFTPQQDLPDSLRRGCRYLWQHPFITWQGELTPCCGRPFAAQFSFGNVFKTPFARLWNCEAIQRMRKALARGRTPEICRGCPYAPDG